MRLRAFFVAHTGIHIPTLCRETLNPHISTGTSNLNVQVFFVWSLFYDVYFTSVLFWRTIR